MTLLSPARMLTLLAATVGSCLSMYCLPNVVVGAGEIDLAVTTPNYGVKEDELRYRPGLITAHISNHFAQPLELKSLIFLVEEFSINTQPRLVYELTPVF